MQVQTDDVRCFGFKVGIVTGQVALQAGGFRRACVRMRCTVDLLTPNSRANLRHDQCVLPSRGFCCTRRATRACTAGVAVRGLLP